MLWLYVKTVVMWLQIAPNIGIYTYIPNCLALIFHFAPMEISKYYWGSSKILPTLMLLALLLNGLEYGD